MLKCGFCGSGIFADKCLRLIAERIKPDWVITNVPRASGRGLELHKTAVQETAEALGIECRTTERLSRDAETTDWIVAQQPDIIFVIDFGHIIKEPLLSLPPLGCINIHPSKLPQYRGSSPLQRALMDGLTETAVSVFKLDEGMDSGGILGQPKVDIALDETYDSLLEKCANIGCKELLKRLLDEPRENWRFTPQPDKGVSFAPKIEKSEGKIDWSKSARSYDCMVRAISQNPGVFFLNGQKRVRLFEAHEIKQSLKTEAGTIVAIERGFPVVACGENALRIEEVQPEGKRRQSAADWLRGARFVIGQRL